MEFASKETTNSHGKYSSKSSPKDLWPFTRTPVHLKKGKTQIFQPLNIGSEVTLISRNQNITGQVIDGVYINFTLQWAHQVYSPVSQRIIGIDTLGNWKNLYGVKATDISSLYQERKPGNFSKISATIKEEARTIPCDDYCVAI